MKKIKNEIKCVIFDLDGTIVDSESVWKDTSILLSQKYGIDMDEKFRRFCCGRSTSEIIEAIQALSPSVDGAAVRHEWEEMVKKQISENGVPLKKGFKHLLAFIQKQSLKIGLRTGSAREVISRYMSINNLDENKIFDKIVTRNEVKAGKPNPDIYQKLCSELNVNAKNCLCIEDSPNGAKAAWQAGLNVILVPDVFAPTKECEQNCCAILNNLNEVLDFVVKNKIIQSG